VNFLQDENRARVASAYGEAFARLVELKRRYDPDNVFRHNHNIPPD
jgi:FAD/FMN-containing dehydrogenase